MKKLDTQLAILVLTGFIVFGIPFSVTDTSHDGSPLVLGEFSGDREYCADYVVDLQKAPLRVDASEDCVDVEFQISMLDNHVSAMDRTVMYRLSLTNHGPDTARNVYVKNPLPKSFVPVSVSGDIITGSYSLTNDLYFVPTLAPNKTTFIDVLLEIAPVSCASVQKSAGFAYVADSFDINNTNNHATQMFVVPACPQWNRVSI